MIRAGAVLVLTVLLAAGLGCSGDEGHVVASGHPTGSPVLVMMEHPGGSRLEWLDPATLEPVRRGSVQLPGDAWSPVFGPAGWRVALGGRGNQGIRIVDVTRAKVVGRVARTSVELSLVPLAWPVEHRLLALEFTWMQGPAVPHVNDLLVLDPIASRVVARRPLRGWVIGHARVGRRIALLLQPASGIGPARLTVVTPDGEVGTVVLHSVAAGSDEDGGEMSRPQMRIPALAVDSGAQRAFVVSGGSQLVEVDLATLDVSVHDLSTPASLFSRLRNWLEPAAEAKAPPIGPVREARWLGRGLIASTGWDGLEPAGLSLIDVERNAVRTVDDQAARFSFDDGMLLAYGDYSSSDGIRAYSLGGRLVWEALEGEPIGEVRALGGRAYVQLARGSSPSLAVLDVRSGTELRRVASRFPEFLIPDHVRRAYAQRASPSVTAPR